MTHVGEGVFPLIPHPAFGSAKEKRSEELQRKKVSFEEIPVVANYNST